MGGICTVGCAEICIITELSFAAGEDMTSSLAKAGVSRKESLHPCVIVAFSSRRPADGEPNALTAHVTVILNVQILCLCVNTKYATDTECKADMWRAFQRMGVCDR